MYKLKRLLCLACIRYFVIYRARPTCQSASNTADKSACIQKSRIFCHALYYVSDSQ